MHPPLRRPPPRFTVPPLERARRRARARRAGILFAALLLAGIAMTAGGIFGKFTSTSLNPSNSVASAADYVGPTATRSTAGKAEGGTAGYIRAGGTYHAYAQMVDSGNPASGTATADAVIPPSFSIPMSAGAFTFAGVSYNYRSAVQTLTAGTAEGTYAYQVDATDNAGNDRTTTGFSTIVDNTPATGSSIQTANGGSIVGRPEANDSITYTYSEPVEPGTILSGWSGAQTDVTLRINNNTPTNDQVLIFNAANTTQLPLGSVNLGRTDYVAANITFGASGTKSKMTMSGNSITVVLGTQSAAGTTAASTGTMIWTPSATPTDRAGNATSTTNVTESGTADREF